MSTESGKLEREWNDVYEVLDEDLERKTSSLPAQRHYPLAMRCISKYHRGSTVLEAGCGIGQWVIHLSDLGYAAHGIDLARVPLLKAVGYARERELGYPFLQGDLRSLPYRRETFDVILSFGVIEHFRDNSKAISEFHRVLRQRGRCLITTPNPVCFQSTVGRVILKMLKRRDLGYVGFEMSYTPSQLAKMMRQSGFQVREAGLLPEGQVFGAFYEYFPVIGQRLHALFETLSFCLETRQNCVGCISYCIGMKT